MNMLPLALATANNGFRIFPIAPNSKKQPLTKDWPNQATRDPRRIRSWWQWQPEANIAIRCGWQDQADDYGQLWCLFVLEVDFRSGAADWWAANRNRLTPTYVVQSPSGGLHCYYRADSEVRNSQGGVPQHVTGLAAGIDICGEVHPCTAEGSVRADGRYLRVHGEPGHIAEPPAWLLEDIGKLNAPTPASRRTQPQSVPAGWCGASVGDVLEWGLKLPRTDYSGWRLARQLIANGHEGYAAEDALLQFAHAATQNSADPFTLRDVRRWLKSAYRSRRLDPWPPLAHTQKRVAA